jgi:hypothetical protein
MDHDEHGSPEYIVHNGWRRIFRIAFWEYPWQSINVFLTGIVATALDMAAFGVIVLAVGYLSGDGNLAISGFEIANVETKIGLLYFVGVFGVLKLSGSLMSYLNMVLVANYRVITFKDVIRKTVAQIRNHPQHHYVRKYGIKKLPRVLRRETRYTSRAISDAFQLPRHTLIVIALLIIGFIYFPIPISIVLVIMALSLPLHMLASRWGARTMNDLIASGMIKAAYDRRVVMRILKSPFPAEASFNENVENEHVDRPHVMHFLNAYGRRSKLTPVSQLISNLTFLCIFVILATILLGDLIDGAHTASSVIALVFGIRFLATSFGVVAQIITNTASYSPLVSELLDFLYKPPVLSSEVPYIVSDARAFSKRVFLIGRQEIDINFATKLQTLWKDETKPVAMLHNDISILPQDRRSEVLEGALVNDWKKLSVPLKQNIADAFDSKGSKYLVANHLILLWLASQENPKSSVLWESKGFLKLIQSDRDVILSWLRNRKVIIYFTGIPKRVPGINRYMVWVLNDNNMISLGRATDFLNFRDRAKELFELRPNSDLNEKTDLPIKYSVDADDILSDDDII